LVLALVFKTPAAVDHFLVSVFLFGGNPFADLKVAIDALAQVSTRALTIFVLVFLFFLPVVYSIFTNKIGLSFLHFDFFTIMFILFFLFQQKSFPAAAFLFGVGVGGRAAIGAAVAVRMAVVGTSLGFGCGHFIRFAIA
jgi:hypothetical protein